MPGIWGRVQAFLTGAAISRASSDAVGPVMEPVRQRSNQKNAVRVIDPGTVAELLAKRWIDSTEAEEEAKRSGVNSSRVNALSALAQAWPGLGSLDQLTNRKLISDDDARAILRRLGYAEDLITTPDGKDGPLIRLFANLTSLAELAAGVQQGHLVNEVAPDGEPILPNVEKSVTAPGTAVTPDAPDGEPPSDVPLTTITSLKPIELAEALGFDVDQLRLVANLSGLPPGPAELLTMWNRNEITEEAVDAGMREGHIKTKWTQALKRMRWAVLGASEYANAYVRQWVTLEEMYKGGALTGHTKEQMDLLYKNRGRPIATVQAFNAWAREAPHPKIPGEPDRPGTFDYQDFEEAMRRSDVQTWYAPVEWELRWAYPPLFQLGRLAQAGALKEDRVRAILKKERYEPQDIDALVSFWYSSTTAKTDPWVSKAQTHLWTALHKAFVGNAVDESLARVDMTSLGISTADQDQIIALWDAEKNL